MDKTERNICKRKKRKNIWRDENGTDMCKKKGKIHGWIRLKEKLQKEYTDGWNWKKDQWDEKERKHLKKESVETEGYMNEKERNI